MSIFVLRNTLFSIPAILALFAWPSTSQATTLANADILTWTASTPGLFISTVQYPTPAAWNAGAAVAHVSPGAFEPTGLTFQAGFNLINNDLIVNADSAVDAQAAYSLLYQAAAAGFNGGLWDTSPGAGIGLFSDSTLFNTMSNTIPSAATDPLGITGIGVVLNDGHGANLSGNDPAYTSFDGVTVNANTVLAKFTYYGDTDLDGTVENYDVNRVLSAFSSDQTLGPTHEQGWANGESDYSGTVRAIDVNLVQSAFAFQNLDQIVLPSDPVPPVPEPASVLMAAIGAVGIAFGWRRYSAVEKNC